MLEGVLKVVASSTEILLSLLFQSLVCWRGVKSRSLRWITKPFGSFNLGMLAGVLKEKAAHSFAKGGMGFNPWYVGGGVKSIIIAEISHLLPWFQSLVCWRGC